MEEGPNKQKDINRIQALIVNIETLYVSISRIQFQIRGLEVDPDMPGERNTKALIERIAEIQQKEIKKRVELKKMIAQFKKKYPDDTTFE